MFNEKKLPRPGFEPGIFFISSKGAFDRSTKVSTKVGQTLPSGQIFVQAIVEKKLPPISKTTKPKNLEFFYINFYSIPIV